MEGAEGVRGGLGAGERAAGGQRGGAGVVGGWRG